MSTKDDLLEAAIALFEGDVVAAENWLNQPLAALGGKCPSNVPVEDALLLIHRLEHGIVI